MEALGIKYDLTYPLCGTLFSIYQFVFIIYFTLVPFKILAVIKQIQNCNTTSVQSLTNDKQFCV